MEKPKQEIRASGCEGPVSEMLEDYIESEQYQEATDNKQWVDESPNIPEKYMPGLVCTNERSMYEGMGVYPGQAACANNERFFMCGKCPDAKMGKAHPMKSPSKGGMVPHAKGDVSDGMPKVPMDEMDKTPKSGGKQGSKGRGK